jgi:hypothetical protein
VSGRAARSAPTPQAAIEELSPTLRRRRAAAAAARRRRLAIIDLGIGLLLALALLVVAPGLAIVLLVLVLGGGALIGATAVRWILARRGARTPRGDRTGLRRSRGEPRD